MLNRVIHSNVRWEGRCELNSPNRATRFMEFPTQEKQPNDLVLWCTTALCLVL
ncbi:MAG: hypothetical protein UZ03_NOB001002751 [Nitrospira sp. OLB3]|nr:MAG: hypothetical protein UZ03_NOB001002751 [Nitrospira sp. OLB3]